MFGGLAPLAATLLASLAQNHPCRQASFDHRSRCSLIQRLWLTLLTLLGQNHTRRQAPSAHHSRCSLIQRFWHTLLTLLGQNHTRRQVPPAHHSRCSLIHHFRHTHFAGRITHADRRHLPITRVARSFSAVRRKCSLRSHSAPWWPIRAPPGGKGTHDLPNHSPKYQPNRPTDS